VPLGGDLPGFEPGIKPSTWETGELWNWGTGETGEPPKACQHGAAWSCSQWRVCREIEFQCNARHLQLQVGLNIASLRIGTNHSQATSGGKTSLKLCLKRTLLAKF